MLSMTHMLRKLLLEAGKTKSVYTQTLAGHELFSH